MGRMDLLPVVLIREGKEISEAAGMVLGWVYIF